MQSGLYKGGFSQSSTVWVFFLSSVSCAPSLPFWGQDTYISLLGVNIILAHTVVRQVPLIHKLCMLSFSNEAVGFLVEPVLDGGCQVMVSIETFL